MGAWGFNSFENDTAADWAYDLLESKNPTKFLSDSLKIDDEYIESDTGCIIIATSEILYALKYGPREQSLSEDLLEWVKKNQETGNESLYKLAAQQLDLITSKNSELNELWSENEEDYEKWKRSVMELSEKLKQ